MKLRNQLERMVIEIKAFVFGSNNWTSCGEIKNDKD